MKYIKQKGRARGTERAVGDMKTECKHKNIYIDMGGSINRFTRDGIVTKHIKGKGVRCLGCREILNEKYEQK